MNIDLYPHQIKAIGELGNGKILCGGVGSGKSRTACVYFFERVCGGAVKRNGTGRTRAPKTPRDLYIITTAKKRDSLDWNKELACLSISPGNPEDSICGINATVDSWNNIKKYKDVRGAFFIFDEQRLVGSGAWVKCFYSIAEANQWILLSATPGDTWSDYIPVFVANGFYRNKTAFEREHVIYRRFSKFPQVDRYIGTRKLERLRASLLVDMPYPRKAERHDIGCKIGWDLPATKELGKTRWNKWKEKPVRNAGELCYCFRRLTNESTERTEALTGLLAVHHKAIIFYNFDYELEAIRGVCEFLGRPYTEYNGHNHQEIPDTGSWAYLVQYTAGAEAWNCILTDTIIFYSQNYSWKVVEQCKGRIDRLNTPFNDLWFYHIRSESPIDRAILRAIKAKKVFNERAFVSKK